MAKICIFNTQVDKDTAQEPFESIIPVLPAAPGYTKAVRLLNTDVCSFEFIYSSSSRLEAVPAPPGGLELGLLWWREFWGDDVPGSLSSPPPTDRVLAAVYPSTPWSREVVNVEAASGDVSNQPATRALTLSIPGGAYGAAAWVTTKCHAPWVRLALSSEIAARGHLLINAHVGGHSEVKELDANGDLPYAYKFVSPQP